MIAKLIVWAEDRQAALRRCRAALMDYQVLGLNTNIQFLTDLARHPKFIEGDVHTNFIPQHSKELFPERTLPASALCQAAVAMVLQKQEVAKASQLKSLDPFSPFSLCTAVRVNHNPVRFITLKDGDKDVKIEVETLNDNSYKVRINGQEYSVTASLESEAGRTKVTSIIDGVKSSAWVVQQGLSLHFFTVDGRYDLSLPVPKYVFASGALSSVNDAVAPMPGVIEKVSVSPGSKVQKGDALVIMIAMKMEYVIRAPKDGVVEKIFYKPGYTVAKGVPLVHFKEDL